MFRLEPEDDFDAEVLGNFVEGLRTGKVRLYLKGDGMEGYVF